MRQAAPRPPRRDGLARVGYALLGWVLHRLALQVGGFHALIVRGSAACLARAYGRHPRSESR